MSKQSKYQHPTLSKWLLAFVLFFSCTFSGYVGSSYSSTKTIQTEQVFLSTPKSSKRNIAYKTLIPVTSYIADDINNLLSILAKAGLMYDAHIKTAFDVLSRQFYFIKIGDHFPRIKTMPQSSDEEAILSLIG